MSATVATLAAAPLDYPKTRQDAVSDDYHGTKIEDPFRWLEDDQSADTKAWVKAQNEVTFGFLKTIPQRAAIRERLEKLYNYERISAPLVRGGRSFFTYNPGLLNQRQLMVSDAAGAEPRLLLDPNTLSKDGTVSLHGWTVTDDGKRLAYGLSRGGSDWQEWRVRDVDTGRDLDDKIEWVKFSSADWSHDGSGFYYGRYDAPKPGAELTQKNEFQKLYFHKVGTPQSDDALIYERKDHADWGFGGGETEDGRYLVIGVSRGTETNNCLFYRDLSKPDAPVVELLPGFEADFSFIGNVGPWFILRTDLAAPRGRVIAINVENPARDQWRELVPQTADRLEGASFVGGAIICQRLHDAHTQVTLHPVSGDGKTGPQVAAAREVKLPGVGSADGFGGRQQDKDTYFTFTSFNVPPTTYRLDVASNAVELHRAPKVDFDPSQFETRQVFVPSKDGTRVPLFLCHKKGLKLDGHARALLYGYGGFDISMSPGFNTQALVWMERGGVYALACLRGGGEYGKDWHEGGMKHKKQNVFDDFIACAEWLAAEKYSAAGRIGIMGGSNGGLLVGAVMTQRPELFGAALPSVGVMDMLRYHRFTIGWAWEPEYGSSKDPELFKTLLAYSPLHNLRPGTRYPATLVTTADRDDRVVPAHSFKFISRLQQVQPADAPPVLIRIETSAGHGAGTALSKVIEENSDELAFLEHVMTKWRLGE